VAASLGCGAKVVDLETAGQQVKRGGERMWDRFTATQRGSGNEDATQGGSPSSAATHAATQGGSPNEDAPTTHQAKLLAAMGRRGGWNPNALCEATGLRIQDVQVALTHLTLVGRIAQDAGGRFAPCH
jgi:predicted Rossmann fold nucleotide-binding protein DprA/Smf involved in DNA uptake